jgi:hypothetical protein
MTGRIPPGEFGQQKEGYCAIACVRYLLKWHGINHTHQELVKKLRATKKGYTLAQKACLLARLGFTPRIWVVSDFGNKVEFKRAPKDFRREWVSEAPADELQSWLRREAEAGRPVLVAVDLVKLRNLVDPHDLMPHAMVTAGIDGANVRLLEVDPAGQRNYPKRGEFISVSFNEFVAAWEACRFLALVIEAPPTRKPS